MDSKQSKPHHLFSLPAETCSHIYNLVAKGKIVDISLCRILKLRDRKPALAANCKQLLSAVLPDHCKNSNLDFCHTRCNHTIVLSLLFRGRIQDPRWNHAATNLRHAVLRIQTLTRFSGARLGYTSRIGAAKSATGD